MTESVAMSGEAPLNDNDILNRIEERVIDLVVSYISGKYDHNQIFPDEPETPIRNGVLVQVIASIVVYRSVKRNASRKVPEDYNRLYDDAIKQLEKIQSGSMKLVNCPLLTNDDGTSVSPVYGNNTNDNYFI